MNQHLFKILYAESISADAYTPICYVSKALQNLRHHSISNTFYVGFNASRNKGVLFEDALNIEISKYSDYNKISDFSYELSSEIMRSITQSENWCAQNLIEKIKMVPAFKYNRKDRRDRDLTQEAIRGDGLDDVINILKDLDNVFQSILDFDYIITTNYRNLYWVIKSVNEIIEYLISVGTGETVKSFISRRRITISKTNYSQILLDMINEWGPKVNFGPFGHFTNEEWSYFTKLVNKILSTILKTDIDKKILETQNVNNYTENNEMRMFIDRIEDRNSKEDTYESEEIKNMTETQYFWKSEFTKLINHIETMNSDNETIDLDMFGWSPDNDFFILKELSLKFKINKFNFYDHGNTITDEKIDKIREILNDESIEINIIDSSAFFKTE